MMKRMGLKAFRYALGWMAVAAIFAPPAAHAQITRVSSSEHRNAFGVTFGPFFVNSEESRRSVDGEVLIADLDSLLFDVKDFNGYSVGGEWLIGLGDFLEAGLGASYYQKAVPSVYRNVTNTNGSEIEQSLKLRIVPITATVRFLPIGRRGVEPYVGAGIGAFNWRYSETGEFVDFSDNSIFRNTYDAKGTAVGPVILGGVRFLIADVWSIGGEVRWQKARGDTKPDESGLLGDKIDLGGVNAAVTLHIRF